MKTLRGIFYFEQHAVDAVAHAKAFLHGLNVDVRGPPLNRLQNHRVHELDDRGVRFGIAHSAQAVGLSRGRNGITITRGGEII